MDRLATFLEANPFASAMMIHQGPHGEQRGVAGGTKVSGSYLGAATYASESTMVHWAPSSGGTPPQGGVGTTTTTTNNNAATVRGDHSVAQASGGNNNTATVRRNNSSAQVAFGNNNTAIITGDNLSAFAGPGNDNTVVVP